MDELQSLGAQQLKATLAGVSFQSDLATAYRICLWSRTANRILLVLRCFQVNTAQALYDEVQAIDWFCHLNAQDSFAISFTAKNSAAIDNSHFGALKVKDAIVDQFRSRFNIRPSIDTQRPTLRINVHLQGNAAQLSLDLSGESLHKRGYRQADLPAPLKENLAAAILLRSHWLAVAKKGGTLLDPMCGSGTLLLEGAMIASDYAPGLLRDYFGFIGWKQHQPLVWQQLRQEALQRRAQGLQTLPTIVGFDVSKIALSAAAQHAHKAGLSAFIHFERRDIEQAKPAPRHLAGMVVCNPPYGVRLGDEDSTALLYQTLGKVLQTQFIGWQAALIISNPELGFRLGIRSRKPVTFFNGALECKLLRLDIAPESFFIPKQRPSASVLAKTPPPPLPTPIALEADTCPVLNASAEPLDALMFANRLRKNLKKLARWAKQGNVQCYRIYDADLPEYAVAIDMYQGELTWAVVQEYQAPKTIAADTAALRLAALLAQIPNVLAIPAERVFLKTRQRQRSSQQYEKMAQTGQFYEVSEGGCRLLVNFADYLDTGLFLDHRPIRQRIQAQAQGKRFLNLFAYTASASVHAAVGGAMLTTSVDMSNTYLEWAKQNMALNPNAGEHEFIQANCVEWLAREALAHTRQYDIIFLDPPTFSNSKRMAAAFDIQRDYLQLIEQALDLLSPSGVLYFSTNFRRFVMDSTALSGYQISDITAASIDQDFARHLKIHYCWSITHAA